jgi:hypothetical protein
MLQRPTVWTLWLDSQTTWSFEGRSTSWESRSSSWLTLLSRYSICFGVLCWRPDSGFRYGHRWRTTTIFMPRRFISRQRPLTPICEPTTSTPRKYWCVGWCRVTRPGVHSAASQAMGHHHTISAQDSESEQGPLASEQLV